MRRSRVGGARQVPAEQQKEHGRRRARWAGRRPRRATRAGRTATCPKAIIARVMATRITRSSVGPEQQEGDAQLPQRLGPQQHVDGQGQIAPNAEQRQAQVHIAGEPESGHDRQIAQRVAGMIDIAAVARPFDPAVARQTAVERVSQPVHDVTQDRHPQERRPPSPRHVARQHHAPADQGKRREPIRRHPAGRDPAQDPIEQPPLGRGEDVVLDTLCCSSGQRFRAPPLRRFSSRTEDVDLASGAHAMVGLTVYASATHVPHRRRLQSRPL